jgi:hypothetical protein
MMEQILTDLKVIVKLSEADAKVLKESGDITAKWADAVCQEFYDTLFAYAPTAHVFKEGERPAREKTLVDWYERVISGNFDEKFWQWQWLVGLVHIMRGVHNHYVMGMMNRVQLLFLKMCLTDFSPDKGLQVYSAFKRVTDVIGGLIVEGYRLQYLEAVQHVSGMQPALIDRMVSLEVGKMVEDARTGLRG